MCTYCGCDEEPAIQSLRGEHATIEERIGAVVSAVEHGSPDKVQAAVANLVSVFALHSGREEEGLFAELGGDTAASGEVDRLRGEHRELLARLAAQGTGERPEELLRLMAQLSHHADTEDTDLFPYAMQSLSSGSWERLRELMAGAPGPSGQSGEPAESGSARETCTGEY